MDRQLVLQELKANRVESIDHDFDADVPRSGSEHGREHVREKRYIRTTGSQWRNRRSEIQSWKRRSGSSRSSAKGHEVGKEQKFATLTGGLSSLDSALDRTRRKSEGAVKEQAAKEIVHQGMLHKTTRTKITSDLRRGQHEHRQYRRFQLTEHSLEYSQLLQRVCHVFLEVVINYN